MAKVIKLFCLVCFVCISIHSVYSSEDKITACHFKDKVDSLAKSIDTSSKLLFVKSDTVNINGTSRYWIHCYASLDSIRYYYFRTTLDSVIFDSTSIFILAGPSVITTNWIDSDSALFLAELQGGRDFRDQNPDYRIEALLGQSLVPPTPPEWYITYISNENPENRKLIIIDATKKDPPTNIPSIKDNEYLPQNFVLYQNLPNPFKRSTIIKFNLLKFSNVNLKIYNLVGQEMETLINGFQPEGQYEVKWQPKGLPSGVYFYQMQAGDEIKIGKMTLLR